MTTTINTVITIPAALRRAGYKALLQGETFQVTGETATVEEAAALLQNDTPALLLAECPAPDSAVRSLSDTSAHPI